MPSACEPDHWIEEVVPVGSHRQEISSIHEGDAVNLQVTLGLTGCTSIYSLPSLVVYIDQDFSGGFSEDEMVVHHPYEGIISRTYRDEQYLTLSTYWFGPGMIVDDGPSPGNGTPSDDMDWVVLWGDEQESGSLQISNVPPAFPVPISLSSGVTEDGADAYFATATIADPAINYENFTLSITWPDEVVTEETFSPADRIFANDRRTLTLQRTFNDDEIRPGLYPSVLTIADDDEGKTEAKLSKLDMLVNNNDDNGNQRADLVDFNLETADPTIVAFDIGDFKNDLMDGDIGRFLLLQTGGNIRVWNSPNKTELLADSQRHQSNGWRSPYAIVPYEGQDTIYLEGLHPGNAMLGLSWIFDPSVQNGGVPPGARPWHKEVFGGAVHITTWGIDFDVDSDNNQGANYPSNSEWEEYLEDNEYAIGKMLCSPSEFNRDCVGNTTHAPSRLRLPKGLDAANDSARITFTGSTDGNSGSIKLSVVPLGFDDSKDRQSVIDGGHLVDTDVEYTLEQLRYNPLDGGITVWMTLQRTNDGHETKQGIEAGGKPVDRLTANVTNLELAGGRNEDFEDTIRWMAVEPDSFYPHLNRRDHRGLNSQNTNGEALRTGIASSLVYTLSDGQKWTLKKMDETDLTELGFSEVLAGLLTREGNQDGLKYATYLDHVTGTLVLAFAGTELRLTDWDDIRTDFYQTIGWYERQYGDALLIGRSVALSGMFSDGGFMFAGHSLGGGLASVAYAASGIKADTFNAAGVNEDAILNSGYTFAGEAVSRLNQAWRFVDAYHMEHDLLTYLQTTFRNNLFSPVLRHFLHPAVGASFTMDGPFDPDLLLPIPLIDYFGEMATSHSMSTVFYGLMVVDGSTVSEENSDTIYWDILGELPA